MVDGGVVYTHRVLMVPIVAASVVVIVRISAATVWIVRVVGIIRVVRPVVRVTVVVIRIVRPVVRVTVPIAIAAVVLTPVP